MLTEPEDAVSSGPGSRQPREGRRGEPLPGGAGRGAGPVSRV